MNNPLVSIILTSYNHENFIFDAINSIINQTYKNFELIIWDDASTDNSWEIITSFSDPRISAFRNQQNKGAAHNVNQAIAADVKGKYVAFHCSDDLWEADKLEKQISFLETHNAFGAVFTYANIIDDEGKPFTDTEHFYYKIFDQPNRSRHQWLNFFFFSGNALCDPSAIIRKSCFDKIGLYRYGINHVDDLDFWIRFCQHFEIFILKERLTSFRLHANEENRSGNRPETHIRTQFEFLKILDHYKNIKSIEEFLTIFPQGKEYLSENAEDVLFALGMVAVNHGNFIPARLFGLELLFEALNDPIRAKKLRTYQGFDHNAFLELSAKFDIFSIEAVAQLNQKIEEQVEANEKLKTTIRWHQKKHKNLKNEFKNLMRLNKILNDEIQSLNHEIGIKEQNIKAQEQEILYYALSDSWRITRPLRKLMSKFRGGKSV